MNKRTLARFEGKTAARHMTTNSLIEQQYYPSTPLPHTEVRHMTTEDKVLVGVQEIVRKENELLMHGVRKALAAHTYEVQCMIETMKNELSTMMSNMTVTVGFTNTTQVVDTVVNNVQLATQHILDKAKRLGMSFNEVHALTPDIQIDSSMVPIPTEEVRVKRKYTKRSDKPAAPLMNSVVFTPKGKRGGRTSKNGTRIDWMAYSDDTERRNAGFAILEAYIQAYKDSSPTKFSKESQSVYSKLMEFCKKGEVKKWSYVLEDYFAWKTN
jgi:hypothetical protein